MSKVRPPYPAEFRKQMVEVVRAGHTLAELSREFNVTAQPITDWVGQAAYTCSSNPFGNHCLS